MPVLTMCCLLIASNKRAADGFGKRWCQSRILSCRLRLFSVLSERLNSAMAIAETSRIIQLGPGGYGKSAMHTISVCAGLDGLDGALSNTVTTRVSRRRVLGLNTTFGQVLTSTITTERPSTAFSRVPAYNAFPHDRLFTVLMSK
jgi:hypothetical protein